MTVRNKYNLDIYIYVYGVDKIFETRSLIYIYIYTLYIHTLGSV